MAKLVKGRGSRRRTQRGLRSKPPAIHEPKVKKGVKAGRAKGATVAKRRSTRAKKGPSDAGKVVVTVNGKVVHRG